jgi:hypothetical protein
MELNTSKVRKRLQSIREELTLLDFVNKEMYKTVVNKINELDTPSFSNDFNRTTKRSR